MLIICESFNLVYHSKFHSIFCISTPMIMLDAFPFALIYIIITKFPVQKTVYWCFKVISLACDAFILLFTSKIWLVTTKINLMRDRLLDKMTAGSILNDEITQHYQWSRWIHVVFESNSEYLRRSLAFESWVSEIILIIFYMADWHLVHLFLI